MNGPLHRLALLLLAGALLSACGYELRGTASLPTEMTTTFVSAPADSRDLETELERLLAGNGVTIAEAPETAGATLTILSDRLQRIVQSVGATARVREFALEYRVSYQIDAQSGATLVPPTELLIRRDFTFDERQVLGTTAEEELRAREMRREMASRIVANISAR